MKYILLAAIFLSACAYTNYSVSREKYVQSEYVENAKQVTVSVLHNEGYNIKRATWQVVETEVDTLYVGGDGYTVEFKTWIKVFLEANRVKAYCSQRIIDDRYGEGKLQECQDEWILERVNDSVRSIIESLTIGL